MIVRMKTLLLALTALLQTARAQYDPDTYWKLGGLLCSADRPAGNELQCANDIYRYSCPTSCEVPQGTFDYSADAPGAILDIFQGAPNICSTRVGSDGAVSGGYYATNPFTGEEWLAACAIVPDESNYPANWVSIFCAGTCAADLALCDCDDCARDPPTGAFGPAECCMQSCVPSTC